MDNTGERGNHLTPQVSMEATLNRISKELASHKNTFSDCEDGSVGKVLTT